MPKRQLLTSAELCDRWQITPRQLRDMRYRREITYVKVGRLVRYDLAAVESYEAAHRVDCEVAS